MTVCIVNGQSSDATNRETSFKDELLIICQTEQRASHSRQQHSTNRKHTTSISDNNEQEGLAIDFVTNNNWKQSTTQLPPNHIPNQLIKKKKQRRDLRYATSLL